MSKLFRAIIIGSSIGICGIGVLTAPLFLQSTLANDTVQLPDAVAAPMEKLFPRAPAFDLSRLRKFDISVDASVSTVPLQTVTIQKFGFGVRQSVTIATTATGTYSSDAITSPYVRYPGVHVTPHIEDCGCGDAPLVILPETSDDVGASSFRSLPLPRSTTITWL